MLVLDALFDHIHQISSDVEIIGSLVQRYPLLRGRGEPMPRGRGDFANVGRNAPKKR
jgi:hypothetical protein